MLPQQARRRGVVRHVAPTRAPPTRHTPCFNQVWARFVDLFVSHSNIPPEVQFTNKKCFASVYMSASTCHTSCYSYVLLVVVVLHVHCSCSQRPISVFRGNFKRHCHSRSCSCYCLFGSAILQYECTWCIRTFNSLCSTSVCTWCTRILALRL